MIQTLIEWMATIATVLIMIVIIHFCLLAIMKIQSKISIENQKMKEQRIANKKKGKGKQ